MTGLIGKSPLSAEARQRSTGFLENTTRRKFIRRSNDRNSTVHERRKGCSNLSSSKLFLAFITCGALLTLIQSPFSDQNRNLTKYNYRSRFYDVGRKVDSGYTSYLQVEWDQVIKVIDKINLTRDHLRVGLLNFDSREIDYWNRILPSLNSSSSSSSSAAAAAVIDLPHTNKSLTWEALFPEWIDEEEESEIPTCPSLSQPTTINGFSYNLIAVKLPCNKSGEWSRDVARFHLQLSAAKLAASAAEFHPEVHVLFVTECFPIPNLFRCNDLVTREGNSWLYKPDLLLLNEKIKLPIGSCALSVPSKPKGELNPAKTQREAYVTILHSASFYVCGAIAAAQSIRMTGSTKDLVILVDERIRENQKKGLESAGWKVRTIKRIKNPNADRDAYNRWNYSKFRLWQLTEYDKIIFIDSDLIILKNIDFLFSMPEITATGNNGTLFNSGVMVIEPSTCTFQLLIDHIHDIRSYNGGDQGYLNEIFTHWHRMPKTMNFLKHFWEGDEDDVKQKKTSLFAADPPILHVIHYLGLKPWLCYRDYDCNWNVDILQEFASDVAHQRWWKVHDSMPEKLKKFCLLRSKQKAMLEWDRLQAEKRNFSDGHWKMKIKDERYKICDEKLCYKKNMLWYWLEANLTSGI